MKEYGGTWEADEFFKKHDITEEEVARLQVNLN